MCSAAIRTQRCRHKLIYCLPLDLQQPLHTTLLASITNPPSPPDSPDGWWCTVDRVLALNQPELNGALETVFDVCLDGSLHALSDVPLGLPQLWLPACVLHVPKHRGLRMLEFLAATHLIPPPPPGWPLRHSAWPAECVMHRLLSWPQM
jgi:hypothetical protein